MVDWSKPIQTRDGRKARLLGQIVNQRFGGHTRVVCITDTVAGDEWVHYVNAYSGSVHNEADDRNYDIINVPERKKHKCVNLNTTCDTTCDDGHDSYFLVRCYRHSIHYGELTSSFAAQYCPFCGEKAGV